MMRSDQFKIFSHRIVQLSDDEATLADDEARESRGMAIRNGVN
jgi:hypothetical protein